MKPFLQTQRDEEVRIRVVFLEFEDRGVREVVVVGVGDHDEVHDGRVVDLAGDRREAFGAEVVGGAAAVFEDGVEEDAEPGRVFDVVAGVAEPGCAEGGLRGGGGAGGEEGGGDDGEVRGGGVGPFHFACYDVPGEVVLDFDSFPCFGDLCLHSRTNCVKKSSMDWKYKKLHKLTKLYHLSI